jgi:hypothetical protein
MNFPRTTLSSRRLMTSRIGFLCDGTAGVHVLHYFWQLSLTALVHGTSNTIPPPFERFRGSHG